MFLSKILKRRDARPRLPNLLCVGVEKCGTTFLNTAFEPCQSVLTPRKKELFYFNKYFAQGTDWYQSWYDFTSKPKARYVADITPSYFRSRKNLERITELLPGAKIIMVLRHPVYRSFSHYIHRIRHLAPRLDSYGYSFADILDRKDVYELLCPQYGRHLRMLTEFFDREDILLLTYENDILNPLRAQATLSEFLELDDLDFSPMLGRRVNEGKMPRFYYSSTPGANIELGGKQYQLKPGNLLLAHAKGTQEWQGIDPAVADANIEAAKNWTASLSSDQVQDIYQAHFAPDLEILREDFDVDVDQWQAMTDPVYYADALPDPELLVEPGR